MSGPLLKTAAVLPFLMLAGVFCSCQRHPNGWPDGTWSAFAVVANAVEQHIWEYQNIPTSYSHLTSVLAEFSETPPEDVSYTWVLKQGESVLEVTAQMGGRKWTESFEIITPPYESKPDVLFIRRAGIEVLGDAEENVADALASDINFFINRNGRVPSTVPEALGHDPLTSMPLLNKYGLTYEATNETITVRCASGNMYTYTYDTFGIKDVVFQPQPMRR